MPETLEDFLMARPPSAEQPLRGQTVLAVEDSRFASDALRMICQRLGARMRRADSLAAARRHLRAYRPGVVLVDIGLPDGSGLDLVGELARGDPRVDAIFAMSGDDTQDAAALGAGADGFIGKPITSVLDFSTRMLAVLDIAPVPGMLTGDASAPVSPDQTALGDDLARVADMLSDPDAGDLVYVAGFLNGLAKGAQDEALSDLAMMSLTVTKSGGSQSDIQALRHAVSALVDRTADCAMRALKRG